MIGGERVIAVIPARGGSKGDPAQEHRAARRQAAARVVHRDRAAVSTCVDRTIVSTDDDAVAAVAAALRRRGLPTTCSPCQRHGAGRGRPARPHRHPAGRKASRPGSWLLLEPTCPFRSPATSEPASTCSSRRTRTLSRRFARRPSIHTARGPLTGDVPGSFIPGANPGCPGSAASRLSAERGGVLLQGGPAASRRARPAVRQRRRGRHARGAVCRHRHERPISWSQNNCSRQEEIAWKQVTSSSSPARAAESGFRSRITSRAGSTVIAAARSEDVLRAEFDDEPRRLSLPAGPRRPGRHNAPPLEKILSEHGHIAVPHQQRGREHRRRAGGTRRQTRSRARCRSTRSLRR